MGDLQGHRPGKSLRRTKAVPRHLGRAPAWAEFRLAFYRDPSPFGSFSQHPMSCESPLAGTLCPSSHSTATQIPPEPHGHRSGPGLEEPGLWGSPLKTQPATSAQERTTACDRLHSCTRAAPWADTGKW